MSDTSEVLAKYRYRRRLPHLQKADADLFVTFCAGGPLILPSAARDLVFEHCLREGGLRPLAGARATLSGHGTTQSVIADPAGKYRFASVAAGNYGWPYCVDMTTTAPAWRGTGSMDCSGPDHTPPVMLTAWKSNGSSFVVRS